VKRLDVVGSKVVMFGLSLVAADLYLQLYLLGME
jgi:hypothetical protein